MSTISKIATVIVFIATVVGLFIGLHTYQKEVIDDIECTCEYGTALMKSQGCDEDGREMCTADGCLPTYRLNITSKICVSEDEFPQCKCPNGQPRVHRCKKDGDISCKKRGCDEGFQFEKKTKRCVASESLKNNRKQTEDDLPKCKCPNGRPVVYGCKKDGEIFCKEGSCGIGYEFDMNTKTCIASKSLEDIGVDHSGSSKLYDNYDDEDLNN